MKRSLVIIVLFFCLYASIPGMEVVWAQEGNPCESGAGIVHYQSQIDEEIQSGFRIKAVKTDPAYPIVIGQDKEKRRGVDIRIEIQSIAGIVDPYETLDGYRRVCRGYSGEQEDMKSCTPDHADGNYYHYWTTEPICTLHRDEKTYRHINGESLQVWLMPSDDTINWLGWEIDNIGRHPLRFMYPEKWALGTWVPGGFTTEGDEGLFADYQIRKFTEEHPGFNFLKADPRKDILPESVLTRINDPALKTPGGAALALYGRFTGFQDYGDISGPGACLIYDGREKTGWCWPSTSPSSGGLMDLPAFEKWKAQYVEADLSGKEITYLGLTLKKVPLDLPGKWYIGVSVSVSPAKFNGGNRTETVPDPTKLTRSPGNGYTPSEHAFQSYMLISTFCNPLEKEGCTK
jgi:hypothetical protein